MKKNILIGFLIIIILFLAPMWATNKLHRTNTTTAIANHGNSLLFMTREHKKIQIDVARLMESNHKLEGRLRKCEVIIESFKELVKQKYPNFIKEGQEK